MSSRVKPSFDPGVRTEKILLPSCSIDCSAELLLLFRFAVDTVRRQSNVDHNDDTNLSFRRMPLPPECFEKRKHPLVHAFLSVDAPDNTLTC